MSDYCNQCAEEYGLPIGDLKFSRELVEPGFGYPELCEGCGPCLVDEKGNCLDPCCLKKHGVKVVTDRIMARFNKVLPELSGNGFVLAIKEIADEECGELYGYDIMQVHDSYTVAVWYKEPIVDVIDEGFSALGSLQEYHAGDPDAEAWLKSIEDALQYALTLRDNTRNMGDENVKS